MSRRADARGTVHGETNVLVVCDDGCLARVDANPNAHLGLLRPRMACERALRINGGADGVLRLPKGNEERVPWVLISCPPESWNADRSSRSWSAITSA